MSIIINLLSFTEDCEIYAYVLRQALDKHFSDFCTTVYP